MLVLSSAFHIYLLFLSGVDESECIEEKNTFIFYNKYRKIELQRNVEFSKENYYEKGH